MKNEEQLQILCQRMKDVAEALLFLNLEEVGSDDQLLMLQESQNSLRNQIQQTLISELNNEGLPISVVELFFECYELEQRINDKLTEMQSGISNQLIKFNSVNSARKKYQNQYSQAEGYFVDKQQ